MEFMRRAKGSISIFLCLILLPMVTYSSMIIDASRLQVARTNIATAGDLAMNAALSEYEKVLQDMYGLFAVADSESVEDVEKQLKVYFTETLEGKLSPLKDSAASGDGHVQELVNNLTELGFKPKPADDIEDLTNLLIMSADDLEYTTVSGSTLANQAIMKRQIIEYMKYKGPISVASTLIPKLEFLKDSSKQTDVVDHKIKYTKTLNAIKDPCLRAWKLIEGHFTEEDIIFGYNDDLKECYDKADLNEAINSARDNYTKMSRAILMSKHPEITAPDDKMGKNEDNTTDFSWNGLKSYDHSENWKTPAKNIPAEGDVVAMEAYLEKLAEQFCQLYGIKDGYSGWLNQYFEVQNSSFDNWNANFNYELNYSNDSAEEYDNWRNAESASGFKAVEKGSGTLQHLDTIKYVAYNQLPTAKANLQLGNIDQLAQYYSDQTQKYNEAKNHLDFYRLMKTYSDSEEASRFADYYKMVLGIAFDQYFADCHYAMQDINNAESDTERIKYENELNELINKYNRYLYYYKMMEAIANIPFWDYANSIQELLFQVSDKSVYEEHAKYYAKQAPLSLQVYHIKVQDLSKNCGDVMAALDEVWNAIDAAEKAKDKWQGKVNELSNGTVKDSMQSDLNSTTDGLKKSEVEDFKKLFEKLKGQLDTHISDLEQVKFFDVVVINSGESDFETFKGKNEYNTLNGKSESDRASDITKNVDEGFFDPGKKIEKPIMPEIDGDADVGFTTEEEEKFYKTLESVCKDKDPQLDSDQQGDIATINNSANGDTTADGSEPATNPVEAEEPTEGDINQEQYDEAAKYDIGAIYEAIATESKNDGEADISGVDGSNGVSSFNVDTSDDADYSSEAGKGEDSLEKSKGILSKIADLGEDIVESAYLEEYFTEMFTCRTDTVGNGGTVLLNGYTIPAPSADAVTQVKTVNRNTPWFGREIEYIIWGDKNLDANWLKNDALIGGIRFALNSIYVFTSSEISIFAGNLAAAIAGWTVIGVPIIQAIIMLGLAVAETAYDLVLLHQGEDVAIYKDRTTFVCGPSGFLQKAATDMLKIATNKAIDAMENKVDDIANKAATDVTGAIDDANTYIDQFVTDQFNQVNTSITNLFITPIMNELMPIANQCDTTAEDWKITFLEEVDKAVTTAMGKIETTINDKKKADPKSIIYDIASKAYPTVKSKVEEEVRNFFKAKVEEANFSAAKKLLELKAELVDDEIKPDEEPKGYISKILYGYKDDIIGPINTKAEELKKEVNETIKNSADNVKGVMRDGLNDISGSVSDSLTSAFEDASEGIDFDAKDASTSKGITLNYKEYCKIFVLIKLAAKQESKMLNRAAALMQVNVNTASGNNNPDFEIVKYYTLVGIKADVRMGTLFPWAVAVEDSSHKTGNVNMNLDFKNLGENFVTINYQAVNGY